MIRLLHTDPTNKNIVFLAKCELDIRLDRIKLSGQHVNLSITYEIRYKTVSA